MKTKDQLYERESVILKPRVVLTANSQCDSQDLLVQEARSSWESQKDAESYGETRSNTADYRIPGKSISSVKLQDARRQNNVTNLIEMFETHQHKEQFIKDMNQKQEINKFSEESQQLLVEIFELCENSAKHQCLGCNAFTEIIEVQTESYANRGAIATILQSLALSLRRIPVEDQSTRQSERQIMFFKAKEMLKKASQRKNMAAIRQFFQGGMNKKNTESHWRSTILAKEKSCFFDRIALERHDYTATKAERLQNAKHWILRLNADGPQNLFAVALKTMP